MGWGGRFNRFTKRGLVQSRGEDSLCRNSVFVGGEFSLFHDLPDDYEDSVSVVAPASGRLCPRKWDGDEWFMVSDLPQLVGKKRQC